KYSFNFLYFFLGYFCIMFLFSFIFSETDPLYNTLKAALIFACLMTVFTLFVKRDDMFNIIFRRNNNKYIVFLIKKSFQNRSIFITFLFRNIYLAYRTK